MANTNQSEPARLLTPDEFYEAHDEGVRIWRHFQTGVRGNQLAATDSPDYCVALAVQRKFCEVNAIPLPPAPQES